MAFRKSRKVDGPVNTNVKVTDLAPVPEPVAAVVPDLTGVQGEATINGIKLAIVSFGTYAVVTGPVSVGRKLIPDGAGWAYAPME